MAENSDTSPPPVRARRHLTAKQKSELVRVFAANPMPNEDILGALARRTGLNVATVSRWFRNQRHYHRLQRRWQVDALLGLNVVPLRDSRRLHRDLPTAAKAVTTSPIPATVRRPAAGARTAMAAEADASAGTPVAKPTESDTASAATASGPSSAPAMYVQTGAIIPPDRTVSPPPFGAPPAAGAAAAAPVAGGRPIHPPCPLSDEAWAAIHGLAAKLDGPWQTIASLPSYEQLANTGVVPAAIDRRVLSLLALVFDRNLEYLIALAYRGGLVDAPTAARAVHANRHMLSAAAAAAAPAPAPGTRAPPPTILQHPPLYPATAPANLPPTTVAAAGGGPSPPGWAPHAWAPPAGWASPAPAMVYRPQPIRVCPPAHPAPYPTPPASAPSSALSSARSSWSSLSDFASGGPTPPVAPIAPVVRPPPDVAGPAVPQAYPIRPPPLGPYTPTVAASFPGML